MARPLDAIQRDIAAAERARDDLEYSDDLAHVTGAWDRANGLVLRLRRELADAELLEAMRDPAYWRDRDHPVVDRVQAGLTALACGPMEH